MALYLSCGHPAASSCGSLAQPAAVATVHEAPPVPNVGPRTH